VIEMTTIRVLVVDDDPDFTVLVRDFLEDAARAVFIVESSLTVASGIETVERGHFDVILLDYKLPDGDGFEFLDRLEKSHIRVPVVIVTNHGDKSIQVRALEAGAVEYLTKGSFSTDLLERTCIYAIGMQEKRNQNGSGPGVGVLIEQLVDLTRDSVRAQTEATSEIREMRRELAAGVGSIKTDIGNGLMATNAELKNRREACSKEHAQVISEVQSMSGLRWILEWIKTNNTLAAVLFVCILLAVALAVVLLNFVDADKIKGLKDASSMLVPPVTGRTRWIA